MIKIAICDDEQNELKIVSKSIEKNLKRNNINADCISYLNAKNLLDDNLKMTFDVVFLDIDMPSTNGLDVAHELNKMNTDTEIVFVTNHDELVYRAFRFKALGFVRKKYLDHEVEEIVNVIIQNFKSREKILVFKDLANEIIIKFDDVLFIHSYDHYVQVVTKDNKFTFRDTLNNIQKLYGDFGFIRVHLRYLVNYQFVFSIDKTVLILSNMDQIPISRNQLTSVKKQVQSLTRKRR